MKNFFNEFKTPIVTILVIFIALFLYTAIAGPIPFSVNSITTTKTDLFTASGQGEVSAVPDQATVYLGVTENAATVSDAQNSANKKADKIIATIKALGITDKYIKTTNYSVTPNYGNNTPQPLLMIPNRGGGDQITGYTVSQNLEIKVKPIDKVNKVIDTATANGANLVGGINFTFSDTLQKSLEEKARVQAVSEAKQKASDLANAAGIRLGTVVNVIESSSPIAMPMVAGTLKATGNSQETTPTNTTPGENTVTVNVTIYYETY